MRFPTTLAGCLVLLAASSRADAVTVYRCVGARDVPVFQDQPCRGGQGQRIVHLPAASSAPLPAVTSAPDDTSATVSPPASRAQTPRAAPPSFFLCTRYNGSRYVSDDGRGGRNAVPLGMLGVPERSLADAYGGRDGIGVSAPGLRTVPQVPAAQAPLAGSYVWIDDECHHASPAEACAYLRGQLDTVESKLRRAFSDEAPTLKNDAQDLREQLHGC